MSNSMQCKHLWHNRFVPAVNECQRLMWYGKSQSASVVSLSMTK